MRRVERLISLIRKHTDNETLGADTGLSDEEFIQFLNDAQDDIYSEITRTFKKAFSAVDLISTVASTEEYSLPTYIYNHSVVACEYSHSGLEKDYVRLKKIEPLERTSLPGVPIAYSLREGKLLLNPVPNTGVTNGIRLTYNKTLPRLDKRRSTPKTTTPALPLAAGAVLSAFTIEPTYPAFVVGDYTGDDCLTVVGVDGTIKCSGIGYSAVSAAGVVTLSPSTKTLATGESIATTDFVVLGKRATTHSPLPDSCERFLIAYGVWCVLLRDSSKDAEAQFVKVSGIKSQIIAEWADTSGDVDYIPVSNTEYSEYL